MPKFTWEEHLAVFGGAFDPPHLGHEQAIQGLFKSPGVECVMIVPAAQPQLKNTLTPFDQRFAMTKLLAENLGKFPIEMSAIERDEKVQYTWQLLKALGQDADQPLAFVIGTDQFLQLPKWAKFPEVLGMSDWIVLLRKPSSFEALAPVLESFASQGWLMRDSSVSSGRRFLVKHGDQTRVLEFVDTPAECVSSTEIRKNFALGKSTNSKGALSPSIFSFIERNKIYG